MRLESDTTSQSAQVEAVAASGIENNISLGWTDDFGDGLQQRSGHAAIVQSPSRRYRGRRVAWILGSLGLRLEQVDVSAGRRIERMTLRAHQPFLLAHEPLVAIANRTEEHLSSVTL